MLDKLSVSGAYKIDLVCAGSGKLIKQLIFKNCLTNLHRDLRCCALLGTHGEYLLEDLNIAQFAFGTGTTPAKSTDTALENEQYRKSVTKKSLSNSNTVQSICSISNTECNFEIREIGVYSATGKLLSRTNCSIEKNSNIVMNITRYDIINL